MSWRGARPRLAHRWLSIVLLRREHNGRLCENLERSLSSDGSLSSWRSVSSERSASSRRVVPRSGRPRMRLLGG